MTERTSIAGFGETLSAITFARPEWLVLLLLLPVFALLGWWSARRRKNALAAIGVPRALTALRTPAVRGRWLSVAFPLAWVLLVVGLAGPRWGRSEEGGIAVGRDIVIVVDLSRSMLADDMTGPNTVRADAAKAAALDLLEAVSRRAGHRVGLVVFAAKPVVLCPLTTDYDHVHAVLADLDCRYPPPASRPGADSGVVSGTRIGAALAAAVGLHDPRFPGSQDIVLLSDGDDPVDDQEWRHGSDAARMANIPVHTVGLGDPDHDSSVSVGDALLEFTPTEGGLRQPVQTRLHEAPLKSIAEETRGIFVASRQSPPRMGDVFRTRIEPYPSRAVSDDSIPQPRERFAWFLGAALVLFSINWLRGK